MLVNEFVMLIIDGEMLCGISCDTICDLPTASSSPADAAPLTHQLDELIDALAGQFSGLSAKVQLAIRGQLKQRIASSLPAGCRRYLYAHTASILPAYRGANLFHTTNMLSVVTARRLGISHIAGVCTALVSHLNFEKVCSSMCRAI